ncbi:MAG: sensor histidine kinase [Nocardioides sp.]
MVIGTPTLLPGSYRGAIGGAVRWRQVVSPVLARSGVLAALISGFLLLVASLPPQLADRESWFWVPASFGGVAVLMSPRRPVVVLAFWTGAVAAYVLAVADPTATWVPTAAVLYQVTSYGARAAVPFIGVAGGGIILSTLVISAWRYDADWTEASVVVYVVAIPLLGVGWGAASRELRRRNEELVRLRVVELRSAIAEERRRIAGEVHDDVGHHLAAISVRARTMGRSQTNAAEARSTLCSIADTASQALTSMRGVVSMLHKDDDLVPWSPRPGLANLCDLLAGIRATGLHVDLEIDQDFGQLVGEVDRAAYRIVQEALANVLHHAAATRVLVTVRRGPLGIRITIADDGGSVPPHAGSVDAAKGRGIVGMQQRAAAAGGSVSIGATGRLGGWLVCADLPLGPE